MFSKDLISLSVNLLKSLEIFSTKANNLLSIQSPITSLDAIFKALHISIKIITFGILVPISILYK